MSKKILTTFILIFCITVAKALAQPAEMQPVWKKYYNIVNEAELLIAAQQYNRALEHYDLAFSIVATPWGKDIENAWMCTYLLNRKRKFKIYSAMMAKNGAMPDSKVYYVLDKAKGQKSISFQKKYFKIWNKVRQKHKSNIDTVYRKELLALVKADQDVRRFFIDKKQGNYNTIGRDSLNIFDSLNVLQLKSLIKTKGFPTEQRVGYPRNRPANTNSLFDLVLSHDRSWTGRTTLDSLLYQMVTEGKFYPGEYALLKSSTYMSFKDSIAPYQANSYTNYQAEGGCILVNDTLYAFRGNPDRDKKIDSARLSIGLAPLKELVYKIQFQKENPIFSFLSGGGAMSLEGLDEEIIAQFKERVYTKEEINDFNTIRTRRCQHGLRH